MAIFLVVGGCGFIGSHLVERLLNAGHQVRVVDDLSNSCQSEFVGDYRLLKGNAADPELVRRAIAGVDGCFYLAAMSPTIDHPNLAEAAHQANLV